MPPLHISPDFQALLDEVERAADPDARGFFDAESLSWRINRESVLFLGGMRAALMQMAHPKVAQGVADHSNFREDTLGRFARTFGAVYAILFGPRESALEAAQRVHHVHTYIHGALPEPIGRFPQGDPYQANDPELLLWVWGTLMDSAIYAYEQFFRPLSPLERQLYYQESLTFARLFGINPTHTPPDYNAFCAWMTTMVESDDLGVGQAGAEICDALLHGPGHFRHVSPFLRFLAAATLPPRLRAMFGLRHRAHERALFAVFSHAVRAIGPRFPESMRAIPQAQEAEAALAGRKPPRNLQSVIMRGVGMR